MTGARAGLAIEPRKAHVQGADAIHGAEGNTAGGGMSRVVGRPCGVGEPGMRGTFVRENREVPCLPVRVVCGRAAGGTLRW